MTTFFFALDRIPRRYYTRYMANIKQVFELEPSFTEALERLCNPELGVIRSKVSVIRAALRSEWERVFPGKPFPGDESGEKNATL